MTMILRRGTDWMAVVLALLVFPSLSTLGDHRRPGKEGSGVGVTSTLPTNVVLHEPRHLQLDGTNCSTSTTADGHNVTQCWEAKQGHQVQYIIHGDLQEHICYLVDGLPCWNTYQCPTSPSPSSSPPTYYIDCRNLPLDQTNECWSVGCNGTCLPALTNESSIVFASRANGCTRIAYQCASFSASGYEFEDCTYVDVLGDGTAVNVKTEGAMGVPGSCSVDVNGESCDCRTNCSASGDISYDCSAFSDDSCAATACGSCTYDSSLPPPPLPPPLSPLPAPPPPPTPIPPTMAPHAGTSPVLTSPSPVLAPVPTTPTPAPVAAASSGPTTTAAPTPECPNELSAWVQCLMDGNLDAPTCGDCFFGYLTGLSENSTCGELTDHICSFLGYCDSVCGGTTCRSSILAYETCYWTSDCFDSPTCNTPSTPTAPVASPRPPSSSPPPPPPPPTPSSGGASAAPTLAAEQSSVPSVSAFPTSSTGIGQPTPPTIISSPTTPSSTSGAVRVAGHDGPQVLMMLTSFHCGSGGGVGLMMMIALQLLVAV